MFNIPGKQAVTITETATAQIRKLMEQGNKKGLRVGVKKGGCAGMEYTMDYVDDIDPNDEIIIQNGDRKSTRLNSSHANKSYDDFCMTKKILNKL